MSRLKTFIVEHISNHLMIYIIVFFCFVAGISAGAYTVGSISSEQKEELSDFLKSSSTILDDDSLDNNIIFKRSLINNFQSLGLIWILGITIIGIPAILIVVGIKGFIIGFTVGFLINQMNFKGIVFVLLSILPQNIIFVPATIVMGVMAISYSLFILRIKKKGKWVDKQLLKRQFLLYILVFFILSIIFLLGCIMESYIAPFLIKWMSF
ncbi:MAG: stage II sporulation protein M [Clostridia bacterium]|nr:stage II sporulation protein M [Clostridia bacterium]